MADKSIGDLNFAPGTVDDSNTLFVVQQAGAAYKLTGHDFFVAMTALYNAHGAIREITGPVSSGLSDEYTIVFADGSTTDFTVENGRGITSIAKTSSAGLDDTYTISYNDGTSSSYVVSNGAKGDTGDAWYVWIRYAGRQPISDSDIGTTPDDWIGVYSGTASTAPTHYTDYTWYQYKGEKGDTGDASEVTSQSVTYMESSSGTVVPSGSWQPTIPTVAQGNFLWTKTEIVFNGDTQNPLVMYSVSRYGVDGSGSVSSVNNVSPDGNGNITLSASDIAATGNESIQAHITAAEDDIDEIQAKISAFKTIVVDASGNGDYTTISDAVSAASDDDIILVQPGTYFETVHAYGKKVHIKGADKKTCILEYHGKDYSNPPLEMAKGSVENLTIIARNSGTAGSANAYCVHIDNDNEAGESLYFQNVRFYNEIHQGVGIGLRHNFDLTFENCEFEAVGQAALYCHDWETSSTSADKTGQKLNVINCTLRNNSSTSATIMMQSQELATNCATCKFVGCSVYNANSSGSKISMTMWQGRTLSNNSFMASSDWALDSASGLNTVKDVNADPYPLSNKELMPMGIMAWTGFNSSKPLDLKISTNFGAFCVCMLQGVGLILLYVFHRTASEVTVTNVVTGNSFSSQYTSITAPDYYTIRFTSTQAANSFVAAIAPNSLA